MDMLAHAIDHPAPATIVLISGDRDFVYAVSVLRLRRYRVIVISSSNIHTSLRTQASLTFPWNGGQIDSMSTSGPFQGKEFVGCNSGQGHILPAVPCSPHPSGFIPSYDSSRGEDVEHASHSHSTVTASSVSSAQSPLRADVSARLVEVPTVLECTPKSSTESSLSALRDALELQSGSCKGRQNSVTHHSGILADETQGFTFIEDFPRRGAEYNSHVRVASWRRHLEKTSAIMNDELDVFDGSTTDIQGWAENGSQRNIWSKCRDNVMSLLAFKHTTPLEATPAETNFVNIPTPLSSPSSSVSSFTTFSSTSSDSTVITSPPASEGRVAFVTDVSLAASLRTSVPECPATLPVEQTAARLPEALQTLTNAVNVPTIPGLVNEALVKHVPAGTLAVACYPHSITLPANLASLIPEHSVTTKGPVNEVASRPQAAIRNSSPASSPTPACSTNKGLRKPRSGNTATSSTRPVPLTFKVLVQELQHHQHQGSHRPTRTIVAAGLMKRDPLVYDRAGIKTSKKFCKYLLLAVKAEIIVISEGKGKRDWVSLNPAWQFKDGLMKLGNTL